MFWTKLGQNWTNSDNLFCQILAINGNIKTFTNGNKWDKMEQMEILTQSQQIPTLARFNKQGILQKLEKTYTNLENLFCDKLRQIATKKLLFTESLFGQIWTDLDKFKVQLLEKSGIFRTILRSCFVLICPNLSTI